MKPIAQAVIAVLFAIVFLSPVEDVNASRPDLDARAPDQLAQVLEIQPDLRTKIVPISRQKTASVPLSVGVLDAADPLGDAQVAALQASFARPMRRLYIAGNRVNLRGSPNIGAAVVGQVNIGASVLETGKARGNWIEVVLEPTQERVWVFGKYLSADAPVIRNVRTVVARKPLTRRQLDEFLRK